MAPLLWRPDNRMCAPQLLIRAVAAVVWIAGVLKTWDALTGASATVQYAPGVLVAIGVAESGLAAWALWRPDRRAPALSLAALLLAVTLYLLTIPPGELERYGCQCFGERFRFQDIRDHLRFNGVLIVMAVVGAWLAKPDEAGGDGGAGAGASSADGPLRA